MAERQPLADPMKAVAEQGQVLIDGPDGLAAAFTPGAARKSASALTDAANEADEQEPDPQV